MADLSDPRYPSIEVRTRSRNPYALVAAVRYALRRNRVSHREIQRFSEEALDTGDPRDSREICTHWVRIVNGERA